MKKILCAFLLVIVSVVGARSDDLKYISMASGTADVMNSVISAGAIIDAFADSYNGGCGFLSSKDKEQVAILVHGATIYPEVRDLTVKVVYTVLYEFLMDPTVSDYDSSNIEKAQMCITAIINNHNRIVQDEERIKQERQSADWQKGKVFTSEQEYNDTLRAKGKCDYKNTTDPVAFGYGRNTRTLNKCKEYCRAFAISNACFLEYVVFSRKDDVACICETLPSDMISPSEFYRKNPYFFMPTWEDYKKLYNIK